MHTVFNCSTVHLYTCVTGAITNLGKSKPKET